VVVAACAPAEKITVYILVSVVLARGGAKNIPLVVCKLPVRRCSTANVLQVALREIDAVAIGVYREQPSRAPSRDTVKAMPSFR
jgi:hypothetical protein